jgi:hypothetical protein
MTSKDPSKPGFKQKAKEELRSFVAISLYLGFFFCALTTYTMLLMKKYNLDYLSYSFAIVNALVIAKVILIGEMAHLGKGVESRPLYQSILYKSFLFALLVLAVHFLEEFVKRVIHHEPFGTVLHNIDLNDLIGRSLLMLCAFIPLFAFRELVRVLGEDKVHELLLKPKAPAAPALSPSQP